MNDSSIAHAHTLSMTRATKIKTTRPAKSHDAYVANASAAELAEFAAFMAEESRAAQR